MSFQALSHRRWITFFVLLFLSGGNLFAQLSARFSASTVSGCAPIVVQFTDESAGNPTQWRWDLGNGVQSSLRNPSVTYFNPGTYNIKLTVRNAGGSDSIVKQSFITVHPNPVVNFRVSDSVGCFPLPVRFTDESTTVSGTNDQWSWDFGDGTVISSLASPLHIYKAEGTYSVTLKVTNSFGCTKTLTRRDYIRVSKGVKAGFTNSSPGQCKAPVDIRFTNTSTGPGLLRYEWDFGDGRKSIEASRSIPIPNQALIL